MDPGKADADDAAPLQSPGDVLGAPLQQQHDPHDDQDRVRHLTRPDEAALGLCSVPMGAASCTAFTAQLAADGRLVAPQLAPDRADGSSARAQGPDLSAFIVLQMEVAPSHVGLIFLPEHLALHFLIQFAKFTYDT